MTNDKDEVNQVETSKNGPELVASPHVHEVPRATLPVAERSEVSSQIPSNLPPRNRFFGRVTELTAIMEALSSRSRIVTIEGIGGVGKTSFALEVAHGYFQEARSAKQAARQRPLRETKGTLFQGFIWLSARDRALTMDSVADTMGRVLNFAFVSRVPLAEKLVAIDELLRTNRYLVVVDNFETLDTKRDWEVIQFLSNLPEPTKVLITSRRRLVMDAFRLDLQSLNQSDALAMMRAWGEDNGMESLVTAGDHTLGRLFRSTGGLPLAIKTSLGQMKQRGQSLEIVLSFLDRARGDLFDNIFQRSWSLLENHSTQILKAMPLFVGTASIEAIGAVARVQNDDLTGGLGQLIEMCLLDASDALDERQRRYSVHPLTRSFSLNMIRQDLDFEKETRERAARYFLAYVDRYSAWEDAEALDRLYLELSNILEYMDWASENGEYKTLVAFQRGMYNFFWAKGYWHENLAYGEQALEAAKSIGDIESQAWILVECLGWIHFCQGDLDEALAYYNEGRSLFQAIGSRKGLARACNYFGRLHATRGEYADARSVLQAGLELAPDTMTASFCESALGDVAFELDDLQGARSHYLKVKEIREKTGDASRLASVLCDLGEVAIKQVDLAAARSNFEQSLKLSRKIGRMDVVARSLRGLARVEKISGHLEKAENLAQEAADAFMRLGAERELRLTQQLIQRLKPGLYPVDEQERSKMEIPEALAVQAIKEAVSFLFGEVKIILKERRERKERRGEVTETQHPDGTIQESSPEVLVAELKGQHLDTHLVQEIQDLLELIEIETQNRHRAQKQIAQQGGEPFAMPPTLAALEFSEKQILQHSQKLIGLLEQLTGKPVEVRGL